MLQACSLWDSLGRPRAAKTAHMAFAQPSFFGVDDISTSATKHCRSFGDEDTLAVPEDFGEENVCTFVCLPRPCQLTCGEQLFLELYLSLANVKSIGRLHGFNFVTALACTSTHALWFDVWNDFPV